MVLMVCVQAAAAAQGEEPKRTLLDARQRLQVEVGGQSGVYYQLLRSPNLTSPGTAVDMRLGGPGDKVLFDSLPVLQQAFFRVRTVPNSAPMDTDLDGINDLLELQDPTNKNPFNPARSIAFDDGAIMVHSRASFDALSHRDNFPGAPGVREVKFFILGVDTPKPELFLLNHNRHIYHYYFATNVLGYSKSLGEFNGETYWSNIVRKNLAGSLVYHESYQPPEGGPPGIVTMEFWPSDPVGYQYVQLAYNLLSKSLPFLEAKLAYHAASETQRTLYNQEKKSYDKARKSQLHVIRSEDLFGQTSYTLLNAGVGFGRLMVFDGTTALTPRDVVIFHSLPNAINHTAGIITEVQQTPLSHVNLIAKQNNTPNAYVKNAVAHPVIAPLIGKYVRYEALADGFTMREATQAEVDSFINSLRPPNPQNPLRDLTLTSIQPLSALGFNSARAYGAKTSNVAEMRKFLPPTMVPDGFGIPFYYYDEFMKTNNLYVFAQNMMAQPQFSSDPAFRSAQLNTMRNVVEQGAMPGWMMDALSVVQNSFPAGQSIRCRSSTNNEDLVGFNGAGLYESYTHHPDEGHLSKSIKQVWASLWTDRAWEERDFYRVNHYVTAMGVLMHRNSEGELANGVGVTKNLIDPNWTGYYVNAQAGENLVTNPLPNSIPEEFLIAQLLGISRYEIQYVTFSNQIPEGQKVITTQQAELLADQMRTIKSHFRSLYGGNSAFAMEIEWKIEANGSLVIKQARPWID